MWVTVYTRAICINLQWLSAEIYLVTVYTRAICINLQWLSAEIYLMAVCTRSICIKVSNDAKIRNRYNQVPHLTQDTNGEVTNSQMTPQTRAKINLHWLSAEIYLITICTFSICLKLQRLYAEMYLMTVCTCTLCTICLNLQCLLAQSQLLIILLITD